MSAHTHIHIPIHAQSHICMYSYAHTSILAHLYTCTHRLSYTHSHTHSPIHTHALSHVHAYFCMQTHVHMYTCVCMCACAHIAIYVNACSGMHTHTHGFSVSATFHSSLCCVSTSGLCICVSPPCQSFFPHVFLWPGRGCTWNSPHMHSPSLAVYISPKYSSPSTHICSLICRVYTVSSGENASPFGGRLSHDCNSALNELWHQLIYCLVHPFTLASGAGPGPCKHSAFASRHDIELCQ